MAHGQRTYLLWIISHPAYLISEPLARPGRTETWINSSIQAMYGALYRRGQAHSIECWQEGELVGTAEQQRRLVREQARQTSAARQAKCAAEGGRSHTMGQGGSGGG